MHLPNPRPPLSPTRRDAASIRRVQARIIRARAQRLALAPPPAPSLAVPASDVSIMLSAAEFRARIFELVERAQSRILIAALYLQDDDIGRRLLEALFAAKQNNPALDVKILVDFHRAQRGLIDSGKTATNVDFYRDVSKQHEHKIDIVGVPVKKREVFGVLHVKGFVFDDIVLYSGASLNNVYLGHQGRYRYDRYHQFQSPALADCMAHFLTSVIFESPAVVPLFHDRVEHIKSIQRDVRLFLKQLRSTRYEFEPKLADADDVRVTPLVGCGPRRNQLNQAITAVIREAREHLRIYTPYFNPPRIVIKEIRRAMKRGVKVELVLADKTANDFWSPPGGTFSRIGVIPYMYETFLRKFVRRNKIYVDRGLLAIHLWKHDDNTFHLKGLSADGRTHLITGSNLNIRAWRLDLENGLLIEDANGLLEQRFDTEHAHILEHTERIADFRGIEDISTYPKNIRRYIKRARTVRAEQLLRRLL